MAWRRRTGRPAHQQPNHLVMPRLGVRFSSQGTRNLGPARPANGLATTETRAVWKAVGVVTALHGEGMAEEIGMTTSLLQGLVIAAGVGQLALIVGSLAIPR